MINTNTVILTSPCDPVGIRTRDPQLRRLLLYPAELPDPRVRPSRTMTVAAQHPTLLETPFLTLIRAKLPL